MITYRLGGELWTGHGLAVRTFTRMGEVDLKARTVKLAFSSEFPVHRWNEDYGDFDEVLDHSPANVDLRRLNDKAPFLDSHLMVRQIGVVESATIDADRKGRATVRFSEIGLGDEIFRLVKDGIRKHVSVGYELLSVITREKATPRDIIRFSWSPFEISSVAAPADPDVGIGRGTGGDSLGPANYFRCSPRVQWQLRDLRKQADEAAWQQELDELVRQAKVIAAR